MEGEAVWRCSGCSCLARGNACELCGLVREDEPERAAPSQEETLRAVATDLMEQFRAGVEQIAARYPAVCEALLETDWEAAWEEEPAIGPDQVRLKLRQVEQAARDLQRTADRKAAIVESVGRKVTGGKRGR